MSNGSEHIPEKVPTAFGMVTPAETHSADGWFSGWADRLLRSWYEGIQEQGRMWDRANGIDPDNRPTTMEKRDVDLDWLQARARFKKRWKRLVKKGLREGWLERDHCYECGGQLKVTTNTTEWVSVPNPDFDPDKPNPYARELAEGDVVIIPVVQRDAIHIPTSEETR